MIPIALGDRGFEGIDIRRDGKGSGDAVAVEDQGFPRQGNRVRANVGEVIREEGFDPVIGGAGGSAVFPANGTVAIENRLDQ